MKYCLSESVSKMIYDVERFDSSTQVELFNIQYMFIVTEIFYSNPVYTYLT